MRLAELQRHRDMLWGRLRQVQQLLSVSTAFSSTGVTINKLMLDSLMPEEDPRLLYGATVNTVELDVPPTATVRSHQVISRC